MKYARFLFAFVFISTSALAETPINGWYSELFAGYTYFPNNIDKTKNTITYTDINYQYGYDAGGSLGFKSRPMRYEAEVTYLNANVKNFKENYITQTHVGAYNNAILGLANVYYGFPGLITCLEPSLGAGLGYGWINLKLHDFRAASSALAYQGTVGLTYNFAENYALNVGYRYVATNSIFDLNHIFQAHMANIGALYRFDEARCK